MQVIDSQTRRAANVEATEGALHVRMDTNSGGVGWLTEAESESVQATATALGAPDAAAATSDSGAFALLPLLKRLLAKIPTLVGGRLPVETRHPQVYSEVVSLVGLAAGAAVYGSVIDLGANRGQTLVTVMKSAGFNQADTLFIQQSDDPAFTTWTYCPRGDRTVGAVFSWSNAAGGNVTVTACPSLRYARPGFACLVGGSAQPAGSSMVIGALPGGL